MRYRRKPIEIEARQVPHDIRSHIDIVGWIRWHGGEAYVSLMESHIIIGTDMRADVGDFVIRGVDGEFYPCKPDIFEATYERVDEALNAVDDEHDPRCACGALSLSATVSERHDRGLHDTERCIGRPGPLLQLPEPARVYVDAAVLEEIRDNGRKVLAAVESWQARRRGAGSVKPKRITDPEPKQ